MSSEVFRASYCLISDRLIPPEHRIRAIEFDLSGYEEWLGLGHVKVKSTSRGVKIKHLAHADLRLRTPNGLLLVKRSLYIEQKGVFGARGTTLQEQARFLCAPSKAMEAGKR